MTYLTILSVAMSLVASAAGAADYEFETLVIPGVAPVAQNINNQGQIVGYTDASGFLIDDGVFTPIAFPGADRTRPISINEQNTIVGQFIVGDETHGWILKNGHFTQIEFPGADHSWAFDINNQGDIVGIWCEDDDVPLCQFNLNDEVFHGWLMNNDGFASIDFPEAAHTFGLGINERGEVVGQYYDIDLVGFGYKRDADGVYHTIDVPGAIESEAHRINASGDVAGCYFTPEGIHGYLIHGYVMDKDGGLVTIDFPGAAHTAVFGMNDHGDVVGIYFDADNNQSAFIGNRVE
jgi:uncharacterized membrane protein